MESPSQPVWQDADILRYRGHQRVGLTDSGYFRHRGIPTAVYGPTAYNMGGVDEYVEVSEVRQVFDVHLAVVRECLLRGADEAGARPS
jgi:acetylornithine deacetylase/succinyl-diaminopimelate desuccinylase-like protein